MRAVIVAKAKEKFVLNKNYREFYKEQSLVDILVGKLLTTLPADDIYLSCEDELFENVAFKHGINFVKRNPEFSSHFKENVDVIKNICSQLPKDGDLLWCTCVEPFFDEYADILECWQQLDREQYDSLNIVYPMKKFILDQNYNPIGFGFGHWHKYSGKVPPSFQISWATAILSRKCIDNIGYVVGRNPYWYDSYSPVVDIDTLDDFNFAALTYEAWKKAQGDTI